MALPTFDKRFNRVFASERGRGLNIQPEASYVDLSSLNAVTDTVLAISKEAKQRNDSIWALKQMSDLREATNIHQMESKQTYVPGSGGYTDGELGYYDNKLEELIQKAPSREAGDMLRSSAMSYRASVADSSVAYEFQTKIQKQTDDFNTALDKNAISVYHNPQSLWQVMSETVNSTEFMGLPANKKEEATRLIKEKLSLASLSSRMDRLDEVDNLQVKLAGYQEINKELDSGKWDAYISLDSFEKGQKTTNSKIDQIKDKIEQRRLAALAIEASTIQSEMDDDIASIQDTGVGVINPDRVKYLATQMGKPEFYTNYMKARKQALQVNGIISKFDAGDTNVAIDMMNKLKPAPGESGYADKMKLYNQVGTLIASRSTALMEDPASITTNNPSVVSAFRISEQKGIQASIAQQQRFGIQPENYRVLTNTQAKSMAAQLNMMGPDSARQQMAEWEKKYNFQIAPGMSAMSRVQNELIQNGLNPNYAIINSLKNQPVSYDLITATKTGYKNLENNLPSGVKKAKLETAVKNKLASFNNAITLSTGRADAGSAITNSVTMLSMHYLGTGRVSSMGDAVELATKEVVTKNYNIIESRKNRDYNFYIPKQVGTYNINSNKVQDNLNYLQNNKKINDFLSNMKTRTDLSFTAPGSKATKTERTRYGIYSSVPGLSQSFTKEQVAKSAAARGIWINSTDGSGVYLGVVLNESQGVVPILDDKGNKYEFKFKELSERDFR